MASKACDELRKRIAGKNIRPTHFLKQYWHKKPLLIRRAYSNWQDPVSRDELAGLACEEGVESRLVMERGGTRPWQVTHGPQIDSRLRKLPRSHWTLLVQSVDRYIPEVAALLESFRFIPDWRVDDVMISFAPRAGTVGPHLDSYDVFLIQGQGRRRWQIDSRSPTTLKAGLDLRILKQFNAEKEWILEPGDMLYLPPHLSHYGVALEECLTYSIGFRSPNAMRLLAEAQERLMESGVPEERYRDPDLHATRNPGEIPQAAVRDLRQLMAHALDRLEEDDFETLIGELLTEPKEPVAPARERVSPFWVRSALSRGAALDRHPGSRLGYIPHKQEVILFADGQRFRLNSRLSFAGPLLTGSKQLTLHSLSPYLGRPGFLPLLITLLQQGTFALSL